MPIFLKSKSNGNDGWPITGVFLVLPEVGDIQNDEELYSAVRANKLAMIQIDGELKTLTPKEFEETWKGD